VNECEEYNAAELAYLGHDNALSIIPYSDYAERVNFDMSTTTEVTVSADLVTSLVTGDDVTASSGDAPVTVWWNLDDELWQIHMKVGLFVGIVAGSYKLRVIIINPDYTNGLVVADDLLVDVIEVP
jgi:hypothetical protein